MYFKLHTHRYQLLNNIFLVNVWCYEEDKAHIISVIIME